LTRCDILRCREGQRGIANGDDMAEPAAGHRQARPRARRRSAADARRRPRRGAAATDRDGARDDGFSERRRPRRDTAGGELLAALAGGGVMASNTLSLAQAAARIKAKTLSPVELTEACLARADQAQKATNAFVVITREAALKAAKAAAREIARGSYRG